MSGSRADGSVDVPQIVAGFDRIEQAMSGTAADDFWDVVAGVAVAHVPGTEWASITVRDRAGTFETVAQTDDRALRADQVQYDLASGPCVDAIVDRTVYCPEDIAHDERWPDFGRRVAEEFGVRSMLSFRLTHDGGELLGGLNLYSTKTGAFDGSSVLLGEIVAVRASATADAAANRREVEQIRTGLMSNREIGVAMGVLMSRHRVSREQAFDLLRMASQRSNRKLREIASQVADTGELTVEELPQPAAGA